ncbi:hypothetical protein SteCoe_18788 [Stentor coeruleus]|uniref:Uncharacterized protein n=1 Tax=Stentor coeruleus TaxID=5963 RepID=A0A1R2BWC2_9CILI|nr:hypothetical protein SteCoe_18788 [Stentor coeruleus]
MDTEVVTIEYWYILFSTNCKSHAWYVKHDEAKYIFYCEKVKLAIQSKCPELKVNENIKDKTISDIFNSNPKSFLAYGNGFPRIATFEIYFRGKIIYSKLKERKWPNPIAAAEKLRNILDGVEISNKQIKKVPTEIKKTKDSSQLRSRSVRNLTVLRNEKLAKRNHLIKTYSQIFKQKEFKTKPNHLADEIKEEEEKFIRKQNSSDLVIKTVNEKIITPTQSEQKKYYSNDSDGLTNGESYIKHDNSNKEDEESDNKSSLKEANSGDINPKINLDDAEENKLDDGIKDQEDDKIEKDKSEKHEDDKIEKDKSEKHEDEEKVVRENFSRYNVTRTYEIRLKAGVENFKKFPVNNQNDEDMNIYVVTSDPNVLKVTNNELLVPSGSKSVIKFSLFSLNPDNKALYLLLKNNGEFLDFYEFKVQFS